MRLCRFSHSTRAQIGLYDDKLVVPLAAAAEAYIKATNDKLELPGGDSLLELLPPDGRHFAAAKKVADWAAKNNATLPAAAKLELNTIELHVPLPRPSKLLLLAGNYNEHITEGGGAATERAE